MDARQAMEEYWKRHSTRPSIEAMFLDHNASNFIDLDTKEVIEFIPEFEDKNVVELAAGIGRFTALLAKKANQLTVVEFMDSFLEKNKIENGHFTNIDFICSDVCNFDMPSSSVDIVFSNWLLMYLSDEEIQVFSQKVLKWLNPGGYLIFRESCFGRGGEDREGPNPTFYRTSEQYMRLFNIAISYDDGNNLSKYELIKCKNMETYVRVKGNKGQIAWVWQKTTRQGSTQELKHFLDTNQYSRHSILRYERIFGSTFVSTGGLAMTQELLQQLNLQPNFEILDVGCGIGGSAFYMARQYGVQVLGIDLSINMLNIAFEYAHQQPRDCRVIFEYCDASNKQFSSDQFDVIYSRDAILHIENKLQLFKNFYKFLKPGGKVLITDYCKGETEGSEEFRQYISNRGYHLLTVSDYGNVLEEAGFINVQPIDATSRFVEVLQIELNKLQIEQEQFIADFSREDYDHLVNGWLMKLKRCGDGDQKWGLFIASK